MEREPVVIVLGTGAWRWVYEAVMVTLAVWGLFVAYYVTRLALSADGRAFFRRNIVDLLAIMPADFFEHSECCGWRASSVSCVPAACWLACSGRSAVSPRPTGSTGC